MRFSYGLRQNGAGSEIKRRLRLLLLLVLLPTLNLPAQAPAGYYNAANGKTGAELKTALYNIIKGHTDKGYDGLYAIYTTSDNLPSGKVWDMYSIKANGTASYWYSHASGDRCGQYNSEGDCYNREHTFCDSWLGKKTPQRSDAHHVVPTDGYVNNRRSSFPHGKVGSATWTSTNGSKLGHSDPSTGYSGTVFEPIDEFKGDFARIYFYMATRYENLIAGWENNGEGARAILTGSAYPAYKPWFKNLMLQWHSQDPVSQKEIDRNNAIYAVQHNRNPFIDHPEYAEMVWGSGTASLSFTSTPVTSAQAGAAYTYNITVAGSSSATFTITAPTKPGWLALTQTGNTSATLTGTPAESNVGENPVVLSVTDGTSTKTQSFTVKVTSSTVPLQFTSTPIAAGQAGAAYAYNITVAGNSNATFAITAPTKPGWLALTQTGNTTATLAGTPAESNVGDNPVVLNVTDGTSTKTQSFTLKVAKASSSGAMETFEKMPPSSSSYSNISWTGDNNVGWSATAARADEEINNRAVCLKDETGSRPYLQSETIAGGCTQITFKHQQKYSGSGGVISLFINGSKIGDASVTKTVQTTPFSVSGITGDFTIKLESNGKTRIAIDDLVWRGASSAVNQNPEIVSVATSSLSPIVGQAIALSVEVDDADGTVEGVLLEWGTEAVNLSSSAAMNRHGELFVGSIPAQTSVGTVYYRVTATDNEGGTTSFTDQVAIGENHLPTITNESRNPENPTSADNVTVSATVTDPEGKLSSVELQWGGISGTLGNTLSMTGSSSTYSATIPAQPSGTTVYYRVKATDQEGLFSESSTQSYTTSPASGINDIPQGGVAFYPNPFDGTLNVSVETLGLTKITVMDIVGRVVYEAEFSDENHPIDASHLKAGVYIVKVLSGGKATVVRAIKQ